MKLFILCSAAPQHGRGQSWMGSQGGSGSMLNNWLMAEALSDLGLQPMEYGKKFKNYF